jgi:hypothetical protein
MGLVPTPIPSSPAASGRPDPVAAMPRLLLVFGLSGWALMLSLVAATLLFLKVVDWPSVGWFVDATGTFAGFGFIRASDGWRELLGSWSLPIFALSAAALAWIGAFGTRRGIRTLRALLSA